MNVIKNILTASLLLASIGTSVAQTGKTYLNVETSQGQFRSFEVTPELQVKMRKDGDKRYLDVLNPLFGGNKSYEVNSVLNVYWGDKQENDVNPTVSTVAAGSITGTSATLNGNVTDFGGTNLNGYGFKWGTTDNPETDLTANLSGSTLTATLSGLSLGTTYYYRAYANNETGTGLGDVLSFTTLNVPTLSDGTATDLKSTEATLSGSYTSDGGSTVTSYGFEYGTTTSYGNSKPLAVGGTSFSATLTGLQRNTTYYWRSFAQNEAGKGYGAGSTFLTEAENPTVTTGKASSITTGGATLSGTLTDNGGAAITSAVFEYGKTTGYGSTATATIKNNAFSATLSGLTKSTTYYYRVRATNDRGKTGYGQQGSFTTASPVVPTLANGTATGLKSTEATLSGSYTSDGGATVTSYGFEYGTTTSYGNSKSVTVNGTSFSATLTGLQRNTTYYWRSFAKNEAGKGYGAGSTFLTDAENPTVTTGTASNITQSGATLSGTLTDNGGAAIKSAVFEYGTTTSYGKTVAATTNNNAFSATLSGLAKGTTYYYRVKATNNRDKIGYGKQGSFTTTSVVVPTVTVTTSASGAAGCIMVTVTVTDNGGAGITKIGYQWGESPANLFQGGWKTTNSTTCTLPHYVSQDNSCTYYFKGYATNSAGTGYSDVGSFRYEYKPNERPPESAKEISH